MEFYRLGIPAFSIEQNIFFEVRKEQLQFHHTTLSHGSYLFVMAEGMPYFKPSKTPVENSEENLEDIEKQACLLFEEFLRLAEPVSSFGGYAKFEPTDSPVVLENKQQKARGVQECCEAEEDLVPDSEIITKGSPLQPSLEGEQPSSDPTIQKLARKMQQAGDAIYTRYEGRVTGTQNYLVSYVLENAASLTYDKLSKEIDNMVGKDRNWSNFALAMCVGKRVVKETSKACGSVSQYFSRYISQSYSRAMQQAGGMESFVSSRGH